MWEVDQALSEHTRFTQLEKGRWKAEYKGFEPLEVERGQRLATHLKTRPAWRANGSEWPT